MDAHLVRDWSDRRLLAAVGDVLSIPKDGPADSFVLHAPLELLARGGLLPHVRPDARAAARQRIVQLATDYEAAGDPVARPDPLDEQGVDGAGAALIGALGWGDLDEVDRLASGLTQWVTPADLRRILAPPTVASLAAAAHASILLYLFPRVDPAGDVPRGILRGPARELARYPDWRLRWFEEPGEAAVGASWADALLDVPMLGVPGSDFIFPVMNQAEESGIAPKLLSGILHESLDLRTIGRQLSRVAAWSMLQEPTDHAPYGWSHCLTLPQAVMGIAGDMPDRRIAVAVAATHVVGFRAALGQRALVDDYVPEPVGGVSLAEALTDGPATAAAVAWHTPVSEHASLVTELATRAASHHDAHLVKYTLASFDAAAADPENRRLYLAAAAHLSGFWTTQP